MYKQTDGVAMGSPLGLALGNIFAGYYEKKLFSQTQKPPTYFRYVDNTFVIFDHEAETDEFLTKLNCFHSSLKFTFEKEKGKCLSFLDVYEERTDIGFETDQSKQNAQKSSKQQLSITNQDPENSSQDRYVIISLHLDYPKQLATTASLQKNVIQSLNNEPNKILLINEQQTSKLKTTIGSSSSSPGQYSKNQNLNQFNETESKVSIFFSDFVDSECDKAGIHLNQVFMNCCKTIAKQCKDSYFLCCKYKYIKCKCAWNVIDTDGPTFNCDVCLTAAVQCSYCNVFNLSKGSSRIDVFLVTLTITRSQFDTIL